jgi:hypothetical protein
VKKLIVIVLIFLIASWCFCGIMDASVPRLINYQGRLTDVSGQPLNGSYNVTFRIYDAQTAGSLLWQETHSGLVVQKGIFSVLLGSAASLNISFDKPYYLEVKVGDEVMSPRQAVTSASYALRAEAADDAAKFSGKTPSDFVPASDLTVAPAANKGVKLDANAKLPAGVLKVYDSGWFQISANTTYVKIHNLGTTKVLTTVYGSTSSDGSGVVSIMPLYQHFDQANAHRGINIVSMSPSQVAIRGKGYLLRTWNATGADSDGMTSCYVRIIMLALE